MGAIRFTRRYPALVELADLIGANGHRARGYDARGDICSRYPRDALPFVLAHRLSARRRDFGFLSFFAFCSQDRFVSPGFSTPFAGGTGTGVNPVTLL
jgi:hypothetical protein